jgi:hypothetical protein
VWTIGLKKERNKRKGWLETEAKKQEEEEEGVGEESQKPKPRKKKKKGLVKKVKVRN